MNDDPEQKPVPPAPSKKPELWMGWIASSVFPGLAVATAMAMDRAGNFVIPALALCVLSLITNIAISVRLGRQDGSGCLLILGGLVVSLACFFVGCASHLKF